MLVPCPEHYIRRCCWSIRLRSDESNNVFYSLGTAETDWEKFRAVRRRAPIGMICLDVANGYTEKFVEMVATARAENPDAVIMGRERGHR